MNSEKVKEIKEKLKEEIFIANSFGDKLRKVPTNELGNLLTLINELESELEKEQINNLNCDTELQYKEKRIAELEKENKDYYDRLNNLQSYIDNHEEVWKGNTKIQLKQFAERLKENLEEYRLENEYFTEHEPNGNLWQMNSSVFCIEVTQDGGLVDETLKEFINGYN